MTEKDNSTTAEQEASEGESKHKRSETENQSEEEQTETAHSEKSRVGSLFNSTAQKFSMKAKEFKQSDTYRDIRRVISKTGTEHSGVYNANRRDRVAYALFGGLFRGEREAYSGYIRKLEQAQYPVSYDVYLSRVLMYSILMSIVTITVGLSVGGVVAPIIAALEFNISFPQQISTIISTYENLAITLSITAVLFILTVPILIFYLYYKPIYIANERGRRIDKLFPHSVMFLYAMSRGGVNILEIFRSIAEAEDTYGEVSGEFQSIVNNVEYVQTDLQTAVLERAKKTPSDRLQVFLEDFLNVIESGSDMENFFLNKSELELERMRNNYNDTLEKIELLSQMYVIGFVAGPIFVVVVLLVMSMVQQPKTLLLYVIGYVGLPLASLTFVILIDLISGDAEAGTEQVKRLSSHSYGDNIEKLKQQIEESEDENESYQKYKNEMTRQSIVSRFLTPFQEMKNDPKYTLVVTIPGFLAYIGIVLWLGLIEPSHQFFINRPYWSSTAAFLVPILIFCVPISYIYERNARARRSVLRELPDVFKSVREANSRGLTLRESFRIVAEDSDGRLSKGLQRSLRQAEWTSVNFALTSFANELRVPRLTRNVRLITQANQISGNVQSVLGVAVKDVENMHKIDKKRTSNAASHLATIILSFVIALFVISVMDAAFMQQIAKFSQQGNNLQQAQGGGGALGSGGFGSLPVAEFRMIFLHITIVLAITAGISGGIIARGSVYSGLKFVIIGVAASIGVYLVMPTVVNAVLL